MRRAWVSDDEWRDRETIIARERVEARKINWPIGTAVHVTTEKTTARCVTTSRPFRAAEGTWCVSVTGMPGPVPLAQVRALPTRKGR